MTDMITDVRITPDLLGLGSPSNNGTGGVSGFPDNGVLGLAPPAVSPPAVSPPAVSPPAVAQVGTSPVAGLRDLLLAGEHFRQAVAEHFGVGVTEIQALSHLSAGGALTPRLLSERLGLTPSSVTSVLDRLETAGMAERARHATDRRQITILLTVRGQEATAFAQQHMESALVELGFVRLPEAARVLDEIAIHLHARADVIRQA